MRIRFFLLLAVFGGLFGCGDTPPEALTPCKKDSDCPHDWFCLEDNFCYAHPGGLTAQAGARQLPPGRGDASLDGSLGDASALDASIDVPDAEHSDSGSWSFLDAAVDGAVDGAIEPGTQRLGIKIAGDGLVTIQEADSETECDALCGPRFPTGSSVTLTAVPPEGFMFAGWGAACSGTELTCTLVLEQDLRVMATFEPIMHTIEITKLGAGDGTVTAGGASITCGSTCTALVAYGTSVTLTGTPNASSLFGGWSGDACTGVAPCTFVVKSDLHVSASFPVDSYTLIVSRTGTGAGSVSSVPSGISCGADCNESFSANQTVTLNASASAGSTFAGWSGGDCSGTGSCSVTLSDSKTVTATFTLQTFAFTVTRAGNGSGTVTSQPAAINCGATCTSTQGYGSKLTLTAAAAANSEFAGWSGGGCSGTGPCNVTINAASSVTATFTLEKYRLTVARAGNGAGSVSSNVGSIACGATCFDDYDAGQMITLTAAPSAGSTFTGWSGACSGTGACTVMLDAASTATATFTLQQRALSVSKLGNGAGSVAANSGALSCGSTCSANYEYGQNVMLTATANAGSTFNGWGDACSGTGSCVVSMTAARAVTATFTLRQFALNVSKTGSGGGTVTSGDGQTNCGTTCSPSYNYGTTVTLTATPNANSTFTGWTGASCSGTGTCTVAVNAVVNVSAAFTIKTIRLSVAKSGNGTGTITSNVGGISCGATCFADYDSGQMVTLSAAPGTGSDFSGWSGGGCTGTGTCTVALSSATSVTAAFTLERYTITVRKAGAGSGSVSASSGAINCGSTCSDTYDYGQTVTLTANPATGSQLGAWSGACTGNGSCSVMVTGNASVTATFTLQQFTLSVSRSGTGSAHGYVSSTDQQIDCGTACGATYAQGSSVTLNASVTALGTFSGWTGACSGTGACTVSIAGNTTVGAAFTANPNYAFVTAATSTGALGYAAAEAQCNDEAKKAGLPGTYVAWLSTDGTNPIAAASRLGKARGWIRPDGAPVADRIVDLASATPESLHTYYPIRLAAAGNDLGHLAVFTGTGSDGKTTMATCTSWSSIATTGTIGYASATGLDFTAFGPSSCRVPHAFYCFGIDNTSTLSWKPIAGRKAFVTRKPFVPSTGIANADKLCQDEADAAGVSGTFLALLATAEQPAAARFDTQGATWVRIDGVPLAKSAAQAMARATTLWDAPLNIAADGGELYDQRVWSGVPAGQTDVNPLSLPGGNQNTTCNDWVSNKNTANAGRIGDSFLQSGFSALGQVSCATATLGVACLQK